MGDFLAKVNGWKPCSKGLGNFFILVPEFHVFGRIRVKWFVMKGHCELFQFFHHLSGSSIDSGSTNLFPNIASSLIIRMDHIFSIKPIIPKIVYNQFVGGEIIKMILLVNFLKLI